MATRLNNPDYMKFPMQIGENGAVTSNRQHHVREQIEQVLFTDAGERWYRPEFGAGVLGCPTFFAAAKVLHTEGLLSDQSLESVRQAAPDGEGIFGKAPADDTGYWCPHRYLVL